MISQKFSNLYIYPLNLFILFKKLGEVLAIFFLDFAAAKRERKRVEKQKFLEGFCLGEFGFELGRTKKKFENFWVTFGCVAESERKEKGREKVEKFWGQILVVEFGFGEEQPRSQKKILGPKPRRSRGLGKARGRKKIRDQNLTLV